MKEKNNGRVSWELIGILVTIILAISGYFYSYVHGISIAKREAQLERVNLQLRKLYGPLYAQTRVQERVWREFRKNNRPDYKRSYWKSDPPPTDTEAKEWRTWVASVFMPLNKKMESLILENADLLVGSEMPQVLIDLSAHIAGYKAVLSKWKEEDYSTHISFFKYPGNRLKEYAKKNYISLRNKQKILIGQVEGS